MYQHGAEVSGEDVGAREARTADCPKRTHTSMP